MSVHPYQSDVRLSARYRGNSCGLELLETGHRVLILGRDEEQHFGGLVTGRRVGPHPLVTGFDIHGRCECICAWPQGDTWQVMHRKITRKEISISGSGHHPSFCDRKPAGFMKEILLGNDELYDYLVSECEDGVVADSVDEREQKVNALIDGRADGWQGHVALWKAHSCLPAF